MRLGGTDFFRANTNWPGSLYICVVRGWLIALTAERTAEHSDCFQTGNVVYTSGKTLREIVADMATRNPTFSTLEARPAPSSTLAFMSDGTLVVAAAQGHDLKALYGFFRQLQINGATVRTAVQLGAPGSTGYVVRTSGRAMRGGQYRTLVPSALGVFAR